MIIYAHSSIIRPYSEAFKLEALRMLSLGQNIRKVAYLMGVPTGTLKRWRREARSVSNPPGTVDTQLGKRRIYTDSFKEEALQRIQRGQPSKLVSVEMKVSLYLLSVWQNKAKPLQLNPSKSWSKDALWGELSGTQLQSQANEGTVSEGKMTPGLLRYPIMTTPIENQGAAFTTRSKYEPAFKHRALKKLEKGLRYSKVAKLMGISISTLKKWVSRS